MSNEANDQLVLICGKSGAGKTCSLRNIPNQEKWIYLGCEAGKRIPFKHKFKVGRVVDPLQVIDAFDQATANPDMSEGIIIDSLTLLMEMYESNYIINSADTRRGWQQYNQFFKQIFQDRVIRYAKPVIVTAHIQEVLNEKNMSMDTSVPVKGALKNIGSEAYFNTILYAKKISTDILEKYKNDLLHVTEDEKEVGYKHVFQTRISKDTTGEKIRSPLGMFEKNELYIDSDINLVLQRLNDYYS